MESSGKSENNFDDNDNVTSTATSSSSNAVSSPKTPVRRALHENNNFNEDDSDEMESPQFPHLIPVYNRRNISDYDLDDIQIGWDDGCGNIKDLYATRNRARKLKKRSGRLFSDRHQRFGPYTCDVSPSRYPNNDVKDENVVHKELNDYLNSILNYLGAKKKNRQLMKSKNDNSSIEKNISNLLDDSNDEKMILCSQAIENMDHTCNNVKGNILSMVGINPLKEHTCRKNEDLPPHCNLVTNNNISSLAMKNEYLSDNDDYLFSAINLTEIEEKISSSKTTILTQPIKQPQTTNNSTLGNKSTLMTDSVQCNRNSSSSISMEQTQSKSQQNINIFKKFSNINEQTTNKTVPRLCTPAEIDEKRKRALMLLQCKLKNKTNL